MSEDGSDREVAWLLLVTAGLVEIIYMAALEKSNTFTRPMWTALFIIGVIVSMAGVAYAIRSIPLGTAYAVWVGIGAVGTAIYGILFLREPAGLARLGCIFLILTGVVGLNLLHNSEGAGAH
ncbi:MULTISPECIES: multidrug efflux SMR transporter [unclassified Gordonia (in: high G+C Gram-positive bacteria)]|uniref:DMT family transporter n=1 Tax=unclassified Gordonia (in: high G+C Gram-positive bacteria) TaxID=2657482 RepID=UPI000726E4F3|nr:ligand-binding protein SH3 [Gordonia sp. SGD-V-85]